MSLMNKLVALHFKLKRKYTEEEFENMVKSTKTAQIPPKPKIKDYEYKDNIFYFNTKTNSNITIFYIHGGAYVNTFDKHHYKLINKLIKGTNALVIAPNYDLIPFSNAEKMIDSLYNIYTKYIEENPNKKMILMGDSAGGGLSLSLALHLNKNNKKVPDKIITLSPCVDLNMNNPKIAEFEKIDPWLYRDRLKVCAKYFSDNLSYSDYRCSPTYGDLNSLKKLVIFVGTKELLNPDIMLFYDKLEDKESNKLIIGKNMLHVYPILPIREAKKAINLIINEIL